MRNLFFVSQQRNHCCTSLDQACIACFIPRPQIRKNVLNPLQSKNRKSRRRSKSWSIPSSSALQCSALIPTKPRFLNLENLFTESGTIWMSEVDHIVSHFFALSQKSGSLLFFLYFSNMVNWISPKLLTT